jgi:polyketide biosynthesis enoyl-CoA hydratase PksI
MRDAAHQNAFSEVFVERFVAAVESIAADREAKALVIRGLPDVFCSGAHEDLLVGLAEGRLAPSDIVLSRVLLELPIPAVAAMEGHAVGGGLLLGVCCDVMLMARESRYGTNFMNMGFTPGMGTTRLLQRAFGEHLAHEMMLGGQMFKGSHFEGRVNYVLPRERVLHKAMQVADRMAEKPRHALELLKRNLSIPRLQAFEEARTMEAAMHEICFANPQTRELIREVFGTLDTGESVV